MLDHFNLVNIAFRTHAGRDSTDVNLERSPVFNRNDQLIPALLNKGVRWRGLCYKGYYRTPGR